MSDDRRAIINTHDQLSAAGGGVAIMVSYGGIRDRYVDGWIVYRLSGSGKAIATNPKAAWYHDGHKWFSMGMLSAGGSFHERRRKALESAVAWVKEQGWYDGEWKRNGMGDFVPVAVQKQFPIRRRK